MTLSPGMRGEAAREVTAELTADRLGSGDVPVLGTPAVLALCEEAAMAAVRDALEPGQTTVGTWVELEHSAASGLGARVRAEAELTSVDGRTLEFVCIASEGEKVIARARHRRVLVDRARFLGTVTGG